MSETKHLDGREGVRCEDCGAFLQAVQILGNDVLRCPWANEDTWRPHLTKTHVELHCDRPLGAARSTTGLYAVANQ